MHFIGCSIDYCYNQEDPAKIKKFHTDTTDFNIKRTLISLFLITIALVLSKIRN